MRNAIVLSILVAAVACGHDGSAVPDGGGGGSDGAANDATPLDGGPVDATPVDASTIDADLSPAGTRTIAACATGNTGTLPCSFEYIFDESACANQGCDKLAIYFPGGGQTCSANIVESFSDAGYVTACALLFGDSQEAGAYPYNDEAPRVDYLIKGIVGDAAILSAWDGTKLLITGASHGATAPVIAMARTNYDDDPAWHGSALTGVCFADGIYDIEALDEFLATGDDGDPCPDPPGGVLSHRRAVGRYYDTNPVAHECANNQCFCDPDHSPEMDEDTVSDIAPSNFAITNWKLIECGSNRPVCTGDVTPAAPIIELCSTIDNSAEHACTLESRPNTGHNLCGPTTTCRTWFEAL